MRKQNTIYITLLLSLLTACQGSDLPAEEGTPLAFSTQETRAGLSGIFGDFKVWGTCTADGDEYIMQGYKVRYDNTVGWTYIIGEGTESQRLQYWDNAAAMYRFHAGAPAERVAEMGESHVTMSMKSTTTLSETCLFSQPNVVGRTDAAFGNTVNLRFTYANARINLAFRYLADTPVNITDIRLTPPAPYATAAALRMDYDWTKRTTAAGTLSATERSGDALAFSDVQIPANSDATVFTAIPWYMIPDPSVVGKWKVSINTGSGTKETEFTIDEAWQPGRAYTYRFEYTAAANLVFTGTTTELFIGESPKEGGEHNFN